MPLIINEVEVIAAAPESALQTHQTSAPPRPPLKAPPAPKAEYWVLRKLTERRLRLWAW
jgi:hypothetical protein